MELTPYFKGPRRSLATGKRQATSIQGCRTNTVSKIAYTSLMLSGKDLVNADPGMRNCTSPAFQEGDSSTASEKKKNMSLATVEAVRETFQAPLSPKGVIHVPQ